MLDIVAGALVLAWIVERIIEIVFSAVPDQYSIPKPVKIFAPVVLAIPLCLFYKVDLMTLVPELDPSLAGMILSAFFVGGGSNVIHDLVGLVKGKREDARPIELKDIGK